MIDVILNSKMENPPESAEVFSRHGDVYLHLLMALGHSSEHPPMAQAFSRMLGLEGEWFVLSPIHWEATHNDALIMACGEELELTDKESRSFFDALATFLSADGFELRYVNESHWLISRNAKPIPSSPSVYHMLQRSMLPALSSLDDSMFWQHFITECQMLFSGHPLNQQRRIENKLLMNGVWIWGAGQLNMLDKSLTTTADYLKFAEVCSSKQSILKSEQRLKEFDALVLDDLDALSKQQALQLEGLESRWYFNNVCYKLKKPSWWQRFWRRIKNENQTKNPDC